MPPTKSESLLGEIGKNTKKIADELSIIANTKTGRKVDGTGLMQAGAATAIGGIGALTAGPAGVPAAIALGVMGTGLIGKGFLDHGEDETVSRVLTLNEALDAYDNNLKTIARKANAAANGGVLDIDGFIKDLDPLIDAQNAARFENEAIIAGIADAQKRLTTTWNLIKDFAGISVSPARAQEVVDGLHAIEGALTAISKVTNDPEVLKELSRLQEFLARSASEAPSAPLAPYLDDFGVPRTDPRVMPRRDILGRPLTDDNIRPLSLGGGSGDDVLFGGAGSDRLRDTLRELGVTTDDTQGSFTELNDEMERYRAVAGTLVTGLADTNFLFGSQADRLRGLGVLLPDIGRQLVDVFDSGTVGAERLDAAVQAVGDRFLDAFEGAIRRGESLGDVLKSLGRDLANLALNEVKTKGIGGIFDILGGLFTSTVLPAAGSQSGPHKGAKGLVFTNARLASFARGGAFTNSIVDRPTLFPMADGMGLMGEAGPEAVLPLTRLANGDLGVSMPAPTPAAASGPPMQFFIDARGADRDGMRQLAAAVREVKAEVRYVNNTLERRAVDAMAYARGRGGNIARAFGGW